MFTQAQLQTELSTDPKSLGYATKIAASDWQGCADLINALTGAGAATINVKTVDTLTLQEAVVGSEAAALTPAQSALWAALLLTAEGNVPVGNSNIQSQALAVWASTTTTRANLIALLTRVGSRAEVLWGQGTTVSENDVINAHFGRTP
jgi:hypothetical protein